MNGTSSKLTAAGAAGAVSIIVVWGVSLAGLVIPDTVAQAFTLLVALMLGWAVHETATFKTPATVVKPPQPVVSRTGVVSTPVTATLASAVTPPYGESGTPDVLPVIPPVTK